jgi:hypothetical protein
MGDDSSGGGWIKWMIGILVTLAVGVAVPVYLANRDRPTNASSNVNLQPSFPNIGFDPTKKAHLYINKASGAAGSKVTLSGDGFKAGEQIRFTAQATEVGRTTANDQGAFSGVEVTVPSIFKGFPGGTPIEFDAVGEQSIQHGSAPFTLSG